ncbi:MAG: TIM-barrel domain-containing protein, partial [Halanaerobiaceae bacterium]
WDEDRFPDPESLMSDLAEQGFKIVTIVDPGVKKDAEYEVYKEGVLKDYFIKYLDGNLVIEPVWPGDSAFPDFTVKEVREWWGDLHRKFIDMGVSGIWNDMNEPAVFSNENKTLSDPEIIHDNEGDIDTHRRFHNVYGLLEGKSTYQALKKHTESRPFVLTRAGFAGIQRYAAVWTGDNRSFWEHLQMAMPMLMNLGMSGVAFCGTDVGGFGDDSNGELLTRWTQMGTFMPFFRNHTSKGTAWQEPWAFGKKYETIIKKYIRLRYKFLIHIYNLIHEAVKTGVPVLRPVVLEFPEDETTYNLFDQFMVGEEILVAPVYQPDRDSRMVYLPQGQWYDYWSDTVYNGGKNIIAEAPLEKMPIFIKAGSIIPLVPAMNYTGEKGIDRLQLVIYPGEKPDGYYQLYEDDGISFDYMQGKYSLKEFSYQKIGDKVELKINKIHQGYEAGYGSYEFKIKKEDLTFRNIKIDGEDIDDYDYVESENKIIVSRKN